MACGRGQKHSVLSPERLEEEEEPKIKIKEAVWDVYRG
jgi:hypothetical protein